MDDQSVLLDRAAGAVEAAMAAGAQGAFASANRSRKVEYSYRDGELEKVQEDTSRGLSISVYVDGRYSSHRTTDLRSDQLAAFVQEAVALTRMLQPDPHRKLPDPSLYPKRTDQHDLDIHDPTVGGLDREARLERLTTIGAGLSQAPKLISWTAGITDYQTLGAMVSSNGFSGAEARSSAWMGADITLRGEGDARPAAWYWGGAHHLSEMPSADEIVQGVLKRAEIRLGSVQGPTKRTLMIVRPEAAGRLVADLLSPASAASIQQKRSFWAGQTGQKMFSDKLTLIDDPLRVRGLNSRSFDNEGIAAQPLPIIAQGVIENVYVDTYYGSKSGMAPTTGSRSNLRWAYGERDLDALIADADDAVLVAGWLGGNSDRNTGDFSRGMHGQLVRNGEIGASVSEMNVTGNLVELFQNLVEVGADPYAYSSTYSPTLVFEGVQFSGA
ncbi:MAG: TldD/PmbA family protein [Myxococcota bacterium]